MPFTTYKPKTNFNPAARPVVNGNALARRLCRESYYDFVQEFWPTIIQADPVWNWHIKYLCDKLQYGAERVFAKLPKEQDLIINVPPGSSKSTICSVMFAPWVWTRMPHAQFINASHTHSLALDLGRKCRDVMVSEKYRALFPEIHMRKDRSAASNFGNTRGGWRYSVGVGGSVIGMHGHFLGIDDPIDPAAALSEADLKTVNNWCATTLPSRKVDKAVSWTQLIMQRLHQNDPTGFYLKTIPGVEHVCLPAQLSDKVSPPSLASLYVNGMLDPVRLNAMVLAEQEQILGQYGYAGQYRQWPIPPGGGMFKTIRFNTGRPIPSMPMQQVCRYWDKAGTSGGGAFTVGAKIGKYLCPVTRVWQYWVLDIKRGQWAVDEREAHIVQTAKMDGPACWIGLETEPGSGGLESTQATTRRLYGYKVFADKPTGDKVTRAEPWATIVNNGDAYLAPAVWNNAYVEEHQFFPDSTYKDQVDASAGAINKLAKGVRVGAV